MPACACPAALFICTFLAAEPERSSSWHFAQVPPQSHLRWMPGDALDEIAAVAAIGSPVRITRSAASSASRSSGSLAEPIRSFA